MQSSIENWKSTYVEWSKLKDSIQAYYTSYKSTLLKKNWSVALLVPFNLKSTCPKGQWLRLSALAADRAVHRQLSLVVSQHDPTPGTKKNISLKLRTEQSIPISKIMLQKTFTIQLTPNPHAKRKTWTLIFGGGKGGVEGGNMLWLVVSTPFEKY